MDNFMPLTPEQAQDQLRSGELLEQRHRLYQAIATKHYLDGASCEEALNLERKPFTRQQVDTMNRVPVSERCVKMDCYNQKEVEEYRQLFQQYLTPEQMARVKFTWMEFKGIPPKETITMREAKGGIIPCQPIDFKEVEP